jgi:uncharacterized protein (TIGR02301 family)
MSGGGAPCGTFRPGAYVLSAMTLKTPLRTPFTALAVAATVAGAGIGMSLAGVTAAAAQTRPAATEPAPGRTSEGATAPFDGDLQRLAEIMGALHYLRELCGAKEGAKWRNEMQELIDAEAPSGERREKIVTSFNRGYRGFQQTYRTCTPAAEIAVRRYLEEGAKISRDITARYAN